MFRSDGRLSLRALFALGTVLLVGGLAVAMARLPEWRSGRVPDEAFFESRLQEVARNAGLVIESAPRAQLHSRSWLHDEDLLGEHETAYRALGSRAAEWLAREGRGPYVDISARSRWRSGKHTQGQLRVTFSLRGVPISAMWLADDPFRSSETGIARERREALTRAFVPGNVRTSEVTMLGESVHVSPVTGASPPETLLATNISGPMPYIQRVSGDADAWRARLEGLTLGPALLARLPLALVRGVIYLATLILFVLLLARRRIELEKGLILGMVSLALSIAGPVRGSGSWIQLVDASLEVIVRALALFVLWSSAESWLRSTVPRFRTSLDTLRAGRLGPAAGRSLLAGSAIGAGVAGMSLMLTSLAMMIPRVAPTEASVRLPMFGVYASSLEEGAIRTAYVLLAVCAALRWPLVRRMPGGAVMLAGIALATRVPLTSLTISIVIGLLLAIVLVWAHATFGVTALLAASIMSTVLPSSLFALKHVAWLPGSATLLTAVVLAPLVFGAIGIRRPAEVEEGTLRLPGFVRRLEEENRVKYEMDLLARMQLGLLPQEMPNVEGYEIAARSILATEVGGDLYDFVRDANGRIWIAAGDVSGHGYSCAIAQAMVKAGLVSIIEADRTPATVLQRLDSVLRGIGAPRTFTSMTLLRVDPSTGQTLVSNAGHPFPWIAGDGENVRELELPSLPLGQGPPRNYADATVTLARGSAMVIFSDGLFEGTDANGRAYGFDRIRDLLGKIARRPAADILNAIIDDWRQHVGDDAPADDTTVVVVKRRLT